MPVTIEDLRWNFQILKMISCLGLLPIKFDPVTGQMEEQSSFWKRCIFRMCELCNILHVVYVTFRTINVSLDDSNVWEEFTPLMAIQCSCFLCIFAALFLWIELSHQENITLSNEILDIQSKAGSAFLSYY